MFIVSNSTTERPDLDSTVCGGGTLLIGLDAHKARLIISFFSSQISKSLRIKIGCSYTLYDTLPLLCLRAYA